MNLSWLKPSIRRIAPTPFEIRPIRVSAPPCSKCMHWNPRVAGNGAENLTASGSGYRFCWSAKGMRHDFSCFNKHIDQTDPSLFEDLDAIKDDPNSQSRFVGIGSGVLPYGGQW